MKKIFTNIVYLNRDIDISRKEATENHLKEHGLSAVRFSAIESDLQEYLVQPMDSIRLNKPQISCLISHLEIIRRYGQQDLLVLEDDVDLSVLRKWPITFTDLLETLPSEVGIVQLFHFPLQHQIKPVRWFPGMFSTVAYFITKKYSNHLVNTGYVNGKWDLSALKSKYVQVVADSVLYSNTLTMSLPMIGLRDEVSNIFPNATYGKQSSEEFKRLWAGTIPNKETLLSQIKNFK